MFSLDAGIAVVAALQQLHTHRPQIGLGNFTGRSPAVQRRALHFTHKEKQQQKNLMESSLSILSFTSPRPHKSMPFAKIRRVQTKFTADEKLRFQIER
jgi:hypothetical protein